MSVILYFAPFYKTFVESFFFLVHVNLYWFRRYSDSAKIVAKTLKVLGFKNCWIVTDGFSGGRGWLQSRLGTDSYNFSFAQVLSPSRIIPAASRFGTRSGTKFLPSSD